MVKITEIAHPNKDKNGKTFSNFFTSSLKRRIHKVMFKSIHSILDIVHVHNDTMLVVVNTKKSYKSCKIYTQRRVERIQEEVIG